MYSLLPIRKWTLSPLRPVITGAALLLTVKVLAVALAATALPARSFTELPLRATV